MLFPRETAPGCRSCVCVSPSSPPFTLGACRGFAFCTWEELKRALKPFLFLFLLFFFFPLNLLTLNVKCDLCLADERGDFCILRDGYRFSERSAAEMRPHLLH